MLELSSFFLLFCLSTDYQLQNDDANDNVLNMLKTTEHLKDYPEKVTCCSCCSCCYCCCCCLFFCFANTANWFICLTILIVFLSIFALLEKRKILNE